MSSLSQIIQQLHTQRKRAEREITNLDAAIKALGSVTSGVVMQRRKPTFTKAGLARIAAAQRARWAKIKAGKGK